MSWYTNHNSTFSSSFEWRFASKTKPTPIAFRRSCVMYTSAWMRSQTEYRDAPSTRVTVQTPHESKKSMWMCLHSCTRILKIQVQNRQTPQRVSFSPSKSNIFRSFRNKLCLPLCQLSQLEKVRWLTLPLPLAALPGRLGINAQRIDLTGGHRQTLGLNPPPLK